VRGRARNARARTNQLQLKRIVTIADLNFCLHFRHFAFSTFRRLPLPTSDPAAPRPREREQPGADDGEWLRAPRPRHPARIVAATSV
jgi:hypothetical protein